MAGEVPIARVERHRPIQRPSSQIHRPGEEAQPSGPRLLLSETQPVLELAEEQRRVSADTNEEHLFGGEDERTVEEVLEIAEGYRIAGIEEEQRLQIEM